VRHGNEKEIENLGYNGAAWRRCEPNFSSPSDMIFLIEDGPFEERGAGFKPQIHRSVSSLFPFLRMPALTFMLFHQKP